MGWVFACKRYLGKSSYLYYLAWDRYNISRKICEIQIMHDGSKKEIWAEKLEIDKKRWVGCWKRQQTMLFMKTTLWGLSLCWELGCVPMIVNLALFKCFLLRKFLKFLENVNVKAPKTTKNLSSPQLWYFLVDDALDPAREVGYLDELHGKKGDPIPWVV